MAKVASHPIEVNGKAFTVRLGWNAIRRIEEQLHEPIQAVGLRMALGTAGLREIGVLFWAGLETARLHDGSRPQPYTLEEVGDLIDEIGSEAFLVQVYGQMLVALTDAFPEIKDAAAKAELQKRGTAADPPPAVAAGIGTGS